MGQYDAGAAPGGARSIPGIKKYVRIIGTRLGKYVEFEFSVNDADLTVELILPFAAFDEFCALQKAVVLSPEPAVAGQLEQLAWRSRQPGLLRRVKGAIEPDDAEDAPVSDKA
jgi:phenol hydroxylase P0 protein